MDHRAQRRLRNRIAYVRQPVMHPKPLAARANEARPPQVRQMPRDGGLRESQRLVNVPYADLAVGQHCQNPQPRGVRQSPVNPRKFMNRAICGTKATTTFIRG